MYRTVGGRPILSAAGRAFKNGVCDELRRINIEPFEGPVSMCITFSFPDYRRRDVDNYAKSTIDCLTGVLFADDSQIFDLRLIKRLGQAEHLIEIVTAPGDCGFVV